MSSTASAVQLSGHRGARGEVVENTLASFRHAYAIGVHSVELDVGMTADGVLVVVHDRRLNPAIVRSETGEWLAGYGPTIASLQYAELARYDVGRLDPGSTYGRGFTEQRAVDGARIPTLEQLLDLTRETAGNDVRLIIEVKTSPEAPTETAAPAVIASALVELIRAKDMASSCIVESFDWRVMAYVQANAPEIHTAYLTSQQNWLDNVQIGRAGASAWTAGLDVDAYGGSVPDLVHAAGGRYWAPFFKEVDAVSLARAHALGLQVLVWTANEPRDLIQLINLGVDGIITDYPSRLRDIMARLGKPLPEPRRLPTQ